jgi:hypothetical protein
MKSVTTAVLLTAGLGRRQEYPLHQCCSITGPDASDENDGFYW